MTINLDNLDTGGRYGTFDTPPTVINPESGKIKWTVRSVNLPIGRYKAFVVAMNGNLAAYDSSDNYFTIASSTATITAPKSASKSAQLNQLAATANALQALINKMLGN
jgi:hypothetical protein